MNDQALRQRRNTSSHLTIARFDSYHPNPNNPITELKFIGPLFAGRLAGYGIHTQGDWQDYVHGHTNTAIAARVRAVCRNPRFGETVPYVIGRDVPYRIRRYNQGAVRALLFHIIYYCPTSTANDRQRAQLAYNEIIRMYSVQI